jgi:membrane protease YdiL (CAAX protease family)
LSLLIRVPSAAGWFEGALLFTLIAGVVSALAGVDPRHIAIVLVLAPLTEEAIARAGVQEFLLRHQSSALRANLATALLFGLAHAVIRNEMLGIAVIAPALLIGAAYSRRRRVRECVALHAAMNALWLVAVVTIPSVNRVL